MKPFLSKPVAHSSTWQRLFQPARSNASSTAASRKRRAIAPPGVDPAAGDDDDGDRAADCCGAKKPKVAAAAAAAPRVQTYLDLGQRSFARIVECAVCGYAYTHGEERDEAAHRLHHRRALAAQGVKLRGALARRHVLAEREDGTTLVALHATDGADALRKLGEVKALLDAELGCTPARARQARAHAPLACIHMCLRPTRARA